MKNKSGGVVAIHIQWICNLDFDFEENCLPKWVLFIMIIISSSQVSFEFLRIIISSSQVSFQIGNSTFSIGRYFPYQHNIVLIYSF